MKKITLLTLLSLSVLALHGQHGPVIPIDSVQYVNPQSLQNGIDDPSNFQYGDTVTIEGIVTFNPGWYGLSTSRKGTWIQATSPASSFGGVLILCEPATVPGMDLNQLNQAVKFYENFVRGLTVKVTGEVRTFSGETQINVIPIESEITNLTPVNVAPKVLPISDFMQNDGSGNQVPQLETGEQWEGSLVEFQNVRVVDVSPSGSRWFWSVQDAQGNKVAIRDASRWFRNDNLSDSMPPTGYNFMPPVQGTEISYLRGIITHTTNFGYQLIPRDPSDVGPSVAPPFIETVSRTPAVPTASDPIMITARISDDNDAVTSATLHYRVGGGGILKQVPMTEITDSIYQAQIPAQADKSYIYYWVSAKDADGRNSFTPDSLITGYVVQVLSNGITSIRDIQKTPSGGGASIWAGDTLKNVDIRGVVTATLNDLGLTAIQDGTTPYSGIYLRAKAGDGIVNLHRGDSIRITQAHVLEDFSVTYLQNLTYEVVSHGNALPAPVTGLPIDSVDAGINAYSEAYEGMLVQFDNIYISTNNADSPSYFGEWRFDDQPNSNSTSGLRADDYSTKIPESFAQDSLSHNQFLPFLRGILYYSFNDWKMMPRDKNDLGSFELDAMVSFEAGTVTVTEDTGSFMVAVMLTNTQSFPIEVQISVNSKTTATEGTDFTINPKTITFPANSFTYTTFMVNITDNNDPNPTDTIVLDLMNSAGNANLDISEKTIIVMDDESMGINERKVAFAAQIFPNPASDHFRLSLTAGRTAIYSFTIQDVTGKAVRSFSETINLGDNLLSFSTNGLGEGMYFLRVQNGGEVKTIPFAVIK